MGQSIPLEEYARLQEVLMRELRLMHVPVSIRYLFDAVELERFRSECAHYEPVRPVTFCQVEIGARMQGLTVLMTPEKIGCNNAKCVFGWKAMDEGEIKSHLKYAADAEQARTMVESKPRLEDNALQAVVVSPLAQTAGPPDVVHFYCDNMQAYHLLGDWMVTQNVHPFRPSLTVNSASCGGAVYTLLSGQANLCLACSGSYNAGKTERGEINVTIPGAHLSAMVERLEKRVREHGGASITRIGDPFPGGDICKNCPLIVFKKVAVG
ncbi:MAG: DUF169 domain-containing protein [Desulfobulbus sp.]|jgi:uncharacterized protein (DUF169 family)